jgi:DNA-binding beta-propeller fold protein YncE
MTRLRRPLAVVALLAVAGCGRPSAEPELVWGRRGTADGEFVRPRAAAIDSHGRLFVVDFTARIQAFDLDGNYLGPTWTTPDYRNGRPSGLGIARDGNLIVCDSHYHCLRIYDAAGIELRRIDGPAGGFAYVSDAVQDADGFFYVSETGERDRISKLDAAGNLVASWGGSGADPGQFNRARALALGPDGLLYVADACNHRIQAFSRDGAFVRAFGEAGPGPGQMSYPYDLTFGPGSELYVAEYGNHRVQKFTADGRPLGTWGRPGRKPGELASPWALAVDPKGRVHIIDTENHRIQRVRF